MFFIQFSCHSTQLHNKRLKRDCQRAAFPVPMSRGGYSCCDCVWCYALPAALGGRYVFYHVLGL
ncbi:hypothetical protein FLL74_13150 [Vibrio cholerae]|nr:hypothetical protein FLL74_13150 [Vibrio cholerae]